MRFMPSAQDPEVLLAEMRKLTFYRDGAGIDMAHNSDSGFPLWYQSAPAIQAAVAEIEGLVGGTATHIMLNRLRPGDSVLPHVDQMDTGERWHLPVVTNRGAIWWDEIEQIDLNMQAGFWWGPVPYKRSHAVRNDGESERIHLVVDVRR
jgi:aspartyl/asparaginyl beta-hydroxylase